VVQVIATAWHAKGQICGSHLVNWRLIVSRPYPSVAHGSTARPPSLPAAPAAAWVAASEPAASAARTTGNDGQPFPAAPPAGRLLRPHTIQGLYDVISPDAFLRDSIDDYRAMSELYATVQLAYSQRIYTDPDLTEKTRRLLREHTSLYRLVLPGTIHELGPAELAALKQDDTSATVKILNLSKAIAKKVDQEAISDPFLISIGEQAEALKQSYEDRQLTTQQALAEFEKLAQQIVDAGSERQTLGLSANAFAVYTALRAFKADLTADQAQTIDAVFAGFPDYKWNQQQASALRAHLYSMLKSVVGADFIKATNALLNVRRA
jgi:type I restriction enzyme R subunit